MTLHVHDMMAETQGQPPDVLIPQDPRLPSLTALGKNTDPWYEPLSLNRTNMQAAAVSDFTLDTLNAHFSHLLYTLKYTLYTSHCLYTRLEVGRRSWRVLTCRGHGYHFYPVPSFDAINTSKTAF